MARTRKKIVDYFSHHADSSHRKTCVVLQNKYGNDGYAAWFQILELLARSAGHFYNFSDPSDWEFLMAETHISDADTVRKILETLVTLNAIDKDLYEQNIIWSQNFVDRLEPVYKKREESKPERPVFGAETLESVTETPISGSGNEQIKLNKSILNNNKDSLSKETKVPARYSRGKYQDKVRR